MVTHNNTRMEGMRFGHYSAYIKHVLHVPNTDKAALADTKHNGNSDSIHINVKNTINNNNNGDSSSYRFGVDQKHSQIMNGVNANSGNSNKNNDTNNNINKKPKKAPKWYYISDTRVKPSTSEEVLSRQAYIMFYHAHDEDE